MSGDELTFDLRESKLPEVALACRRRRAIGDASPMAVRAKKAAVLEVNLMFD